MLRDFLEPGAPLEVPKARDIVPKLKKLLEEARRAKIPIVYVCDSHREFDWEFSIWPKHCVEGTRGSEVVDELKPERGDIIVRKRRYSGFYGTDLEMVLRELGIEEVIVTGILTNICVLFTAADAFMRGFKVVVVRDCTASTSSELHEAALKIMEVALKARIVTSEELIKELTSRS